MLFLVENSSTLEEHIHSDTWRQRRFQPDQRNRRAYAIEGFHRAPSKPAFADIAELAMSAVALFRGKLRERQIRERISAERAFAATVQRGRSGRRW